MALIDLPGSVVSAHSMIRGTRIYSSSISLSCRRRRTPATTRRQYCPIRGRSRGIQTTLAAVGGVLSDNPGRRPATPMGVGFTVLAGLIVAMRRTRARSRPFRRKVRALRSLDAANGEISMSNTAPSVVSRVQAMSTAPGLSAQAAGREPWAEITGSPRRGPDPRRIALLTDFAATLSNESRPKWRNWQTALGSGPSPSNGGCRFNSCLRH